MAGRQSSEAAKGGLADKCIVKGERRTRRVRYMQGPMGKKGIHRQIKPEEENGPRKVKSAASTCRPKQGRRPRLFSYLSNDSTRAAGC